MRFFAAILAVFFGTSVALAQGGDPKISYAPKAPAKIAAKSAKAKPKAKSAAKTKAARQDSPAPAKPKSAAAKADPPAPKAKPESAETSAKPTTSGSANAATPAANSAGLRESYMAIPLAERLAIQSDLIWSGDYKGPIDGEFSDRLVDAVKAYQKRQKSKVTGVPSPQERAALAAAARPKQEEVGWRLTEDPVTGARVGLPGKLATRTTPGASGTRWSSEQGQLQIETFRIDTGATLEAVFEQQKKQPRRRVTFNVLHPDSFVVAGMQGLKKLYVRAFAKNDEVRGITILYDQAMDGTMDPLVGAMSSAFVPFASYQVASTGTVGVPRRKVEYGTGLVVSPSGHIVTARQMVAGCHVITIPGLGNAERLAEAKDGDIALLRVYGARNLVPIGTTGAASAGNSVTLVGIADPQMQGGGGVISTAPARLGAGANADTLEPAPAPGFSGAAALDRQGRMLGMAVHKSSLMAGIADAPQAAMVPLAKIRPFLEANHIAPATGHPGVADAKASVVRVICVRK
jgi:peptidoglycan hydrolase-like protein with peptidoglycan-binding domain